MSSRRWLVPEVIQTSGMDCGPASLKALLEGFGVPVSYGRLREACQTDVDGTSISTMEEVATQLGLEAEEIMLPPDHVLLPPSEALPAIVVVRLPSGFTHFVVVWSVVGDLVQVMDPATGRRWMRRGALLAMLYRHQLAVPAEAWREFAGGDSFLGGLRVRLGRLKLADPASLLSAATADPTWAGLGALDAAARLVQSVVDAGGLRPGAEAEAAVVRLLGAPAEIPPLFWSVQDTEPDEDGDPQLRMRGAVLVRAVSRIEADRSALSPELQAALTEAPPRPLRTLLGQLRADGLLAPAALAGALAVSAGTLLIEAVLLRGLLEAGPLLGLSGQRAAAIFALGTLIALGALLELSVTRGVLAAGRRLEGQLRQAFLAKIPRLPDRYFQSRLISDMAERGHSAHLLRRVPMLGMSALRGALLLAMTTAAITWLDPAAGPYALAAAAASVILPLVFHPLLSEQDLKVRAQLGALSRFYLDALMGLSPIRAHGAARAVRREHESLLVSWGQAGLALQRSAVLIEGLIALAGFGMAVLLVSAHALQSADSGAGLLLLYWALSLPAHGATVAVASRQYPTMRSVTLRLMEPLLAPASPIPDAADNDNDDAADARVGVSIAADGLGVVAGGSPILRGLTFQIPAGSHVAIVGPSGSGKSSLVGLLLGWHRPAAGRLSVDGAPLTLARLPALRQQTAWLDPEVRLWNRSLLANLRYGAPADAEAADRVLADASLMGVLARLPDGLQSPLGEGGGLVSGGEGQRVRFARALSRGPVRLAILDEPFRGLDRRTRRTLLAAARRRWAAATLLCVTHDVSQTLGFERVLVVEQGQIVEDGAPEALRRQPGSRYGALLAAEARVQGSLWRGAGWRRLWMDRGTLTERSDDAEAP